MANQSLSLITKVSLAGCVVSAYFFCMQNLLESVQRTERGQTKCPKAQLINQPIHANRQLETASSQQHQHIQPTQKLDTAASIYGRTQFKSVIYSECVCPASKINLQPVSHFRRALSNAHTERGERVKAIGPTN